jgi:hypothetical protein
MSEKNINEQLMDAVAYIDLKAVKRCLESGADPSYIQHGDENDPVGTMQPTTPLRMVMFRISDNLLVEGDLKQFAEIAKLLLSYGADPKPAMEIAEHRYGKYQPTNFGENAFLDVWHIVANAQ